MAEKEPPQKIYVQGQEQKTAELIQTSGWSTTTMSDKFKAAWYLQTGKGIDPNHFICYDHEAACLNLRHCLKPTCQEPLIFHSDVTSSVVNCESQYHFTPMEKFNWMNFK